MFDPKRTKKFYIYIHILSIILETASQNKIFTRVTESLVSLVSPTTKPSGRYCDQPCMFSWLLSQCVAGLALSLGDSRGAGDGAVSGARAGSSPLIWVQGITQCCSLSQAAADVRGLRQSSQAASLGLGLGVPGESGQLVAGKEKEQMGGFCSHWVVKLSLERTGVFQTIVDEHTTCSVWYNNSICKVNCIFFLLFYKSV